MKSQRPIVVGAQPLPGHTAISDAEEAGLINSSCGSRLLFLYDIYWTTAYQSALSVLHLHRQYSIGMDVSLATIMNAFEICLHRQQELQDQLKRILNDIFPEHSKPKGGSYGRVVLGNARIANATIRFNSIINKLKHNGTKMGSQVIEIKERKHVLYFLTSIYGSAFRTDLELHKSPQHAFSIPMDCKLMIYCMIIIDDLIYDRLRSLVDNVSHNVMPLQELKSFSMAFNQFPFLLDPQFDIYGDKCLYAKPDRHNRVFYLELGNYKTTNATDAPFKIKSTVEFMSFAGQPFEAPYSDASSRPEGFTKLDYLERHRIPAVLAAHRDNS